MSSTSSTDTLESLCHTINLIDNWLQCFEYSYGEKQVKTNMRELFDETPLSYPPRNPDNYKNIYTAKISTVG